MNKLSKGLLACSLVTDHAAGSSLDCNECFPEATNESSVASSCKAHVRQLQAVISQAQPRGESEAPVQTNLKSLRSCSAASARCVASMVRLH